MFQMNLAYFQPIATLLVGLAGGCVAIWAIISNRELARKKATIDFFSKYDIEEYSKTPDQDESIYRILHKFDDSNIESRDIDLLKKDFYKYELMSIGIFQKIFDEEICKSYVGSHLCSYDKFRVHMIDIPRLETQNALIFEHVEKLIKKWKPHYPDSNLGNT